MAELQLETQNLTRSCHEAIILSALAEGPRHGYQLVLDIEDRSGGVFRFNHGTLYPILHAMEARGLISGTWDEPIGKRRRRRYKLTSSGHAELTELRNAWSTFFTTLFDVIGRTEP
jgi:DNA-binding PadR family transcriptional regulator